jgi:hypothetical protein
VQQEVMLQPQYLLSAMLSKQVPRLVSSHLCHLPLLLRLSLAQHQVKFQAKFLRSVLHQALKRAPGLAPILHCRCLLVQQEVMLQAQYLLPAMLPVSKQLPRLV